MKSLNDEKFLLSNKDKRLALLVWLRLSRFYNQSIRQTNNHLQQWGITTVQCDALNQIGVHQPITQQELGERLEVTKGNITQLFPFFLTIALYLLRSLLIFHLILAV